MKLKLLRTKLTDDYTTGQLYINDEFFCFTLEDKVREEDGVAVEKWKVEHQTAIPRGIYDVSLDLSPKFGPDTIFVHKVPGFTGVRVHSGNTHEHTSGCIIVGYRVVNGVIVPGTTKPALRDLKRNIRLAKDAVTLQVI